MVYLLSDPTTTTLGIQPSCDSEDPKRNDFSPTYLADRAVHLQRMIQRISVV